MAVPTTWIDGSVSRICGISLRMSAESSTTSTRTSGPAHLVSCLPSRGAQRHPRALGVGQQQTAMVGPPLPGVCAQRVHNGRQIQNQHNVPIPQDGGAAHQVSRDGLVVQRFDDQFFFPLERVYHQPNLLSPMAMTSTKILRGYPSVLRRRATQAQQRQDLVAQLQHFAVIDLMYFGFEGARNFGDRV